MAEQSKPDRAQVIQEWREAATELVTFGEQLLHAIQDSWGHSAEPPDVRAATLRLQEALKAMQAMVRARESQETLSHARTAARRAADDMKHALENDLKQLAEALSQPEEY